MTHFSLIDERCMRRALSLAEKGRGRVSPNPVVGAVIVKGKQVIAEGYHAVFGGAHAEVVALQQAAKKKKSVRGATMYVTLEPCSHELKKTPPCVPAIIASGITRVVVAHHDLNPHVDGRGIAALKKAGIVVEVACMEDEAHDQNAFFFYAQVNKRPYISLKIASSLDGRIAVASGDSKWITGPESRAYVKKMRDRYDAILVGKNTVLLDDPHLAGEKNEPMRIILDHRLEISPRADVFRDGRAIVVITAKLSMAKRTAFEKKKVKILSMPARYTLDELAQALYEMGINSVLVEGGGQVFGSFLRENAYNDVYWFTAPCILGDSSRASVAGVDLKKMTDRIQLHRVSTKKMGADILQIFTHPDHQ